MALFSRIRDRQPEAPRPTKRARKVTYGELEAAIAAVIAELDPEGSTVQTLWRLATIADAANHGDSVTLDGSAPVTVAELDEALVEAQELELASGTLSVLKRVRVLVVDAETRHADQDAKAGASPVSRAEFDALLAAFAVALAQVDLAAAATPGSLDAKLGTRLECIAESPEAHGLSGSEASTFKRLLTAMDRAAGNASARARRHARPYGGQPWATL